jgi:hypothetical protein
LNEFDEDRDHDRGGELAEMDTLGRSWSVGLRGRQRSRETERGRRKWKKKKNRRRGAVLKEKEKSEKKLGFFCVFSLFS